MMQRYFAIYLFLLLAVPLAYTLEQLDDNRQEKLISTFQIVRFPNDACIGTNARNGTCYTSAECSDKDGTSSGSCADGFGVCCSFVISTCDQTTSENITYWTQPATVEEGTCGLTVCPVSDDICQIRLDFLTFVITGPSTLTISQVRRQFGQAYGDLDDAAVLMGSNYATNCLLDHFSVQGPSASSTPPIICGTNSLMHMYVEADEDRCNKLMFYLAGANDAIGVTLTNTRGLAALQATRTWDITVTQYECTHPLLPAPGCTQYFHGGTTTYTIQSYNYSTTTASKTVFTSLHLANQHQRICFRRERGNCQACFSNTNADDFSVSGNPTIVGHYSYVGGCCGYTTVAGAAYAAGVLPGQAAAISTQYGFDCVIIPGAFGATATVIPLAIQVAAASAQTLFGTATGAASASGPTPWPPQICGGGGGFGVGASDLNTAAAFTDVDGHVVPLTVCTRSVPFLFEFLSDDLEGQGSTGGNTEYSPIAAQGLNQGFSLKVTQMACA